MLVSLAVLVMAGCGAGRASAPSGGSGGGNNGGSGDSGGLSGSSESSGGLEAGAAGATEAGTGSGGSSGTGGNEEGGSGGAGVNDACAFHVSARVSPKIATVGIVEWDSGLSDIENAEIEFGLDRYYGMTAPVDLAEPEHRTLLLGMKPSTEYHYRIVATNAGTRCTSDDFSLTTGALRSNLPEVDVVTNAPERIAGGFLVSCFLEDGPAFILDADGDYVWAYGSGEMGRSLLSYDGKHLWYAGVNVAGGSGSMRRVSMDGLTEEDFSEEFGDIHHDFTVLPDETVAFLQHNDEEDWIMERAPDGSVSAVVSVQAAHGQPGGAAHANSIHYSTEDDTYTVSDLGYDLYVKVTRQGETVWVLGGANSDFSGTGASWERQHGHHVLAPDRLLIFSNGAIGTAPSVAIEILLNLTEMTATRVWEYEGGVRALIFGDVQRPDNGNTLVNYSNAGEIHEVDPSGSLVQAISWQLGGATGYSMKRQSLYGPPPK